MSSQPTFDNDDVDLTAAEYVLGVLDPQARRQAQQRVDHDPSFAAEAARWESWFSPWLQSIAPVDAPEGVWPRVRTTLWQHELPERGTKPAATARPSLWDSLGFWRGLAAGGFAVAVASVAVLLLSARQLPTTAPSVPTPVVVAPPPAAAPMVVSLVQDDGSTAYTATIDTARGTVALVPVHLGGDPTLSPELWLIPAGDKPHSLGMIKRGEAMLVDIPANLRAAAKSDSLFAVSLEPAGSQPHEAPTGPVVAKGNLIRL
jgi:anti-sigma-K factor RskA